LDSHNCMPPCSPAACFVAGRRPTPSEPSELNIGKLPLWLGTGVSDDSNSAGAVTVAILLLCRPT
jgi:hypothetical protein